MAKVGRKQEWTQKPGVQSQPARAGSSGAGWPADGVHIGQDCPGLGPLARGVGLLGNQGAIGPALKVLTAGGRQLTAVLTSGQHRAAAEGVGAGDPSGPLPQYHGG